MMANNFHNNALKKGTILKSPELRYKIKEILGSGGFGITYKVSANVMQGNIPIHTYFAVKEHFLSDCCERSDDYTVNVSKTQSITYKQSMEDFKAEATRLNELSGQHKGIVRVNEVFHANNTVYYVMEYLNGNSIRKEVKSNGPYSEEKALIIIKEVADAVHFLHKERITHLDIKPDNIIMHQFPDDDETYPVLIDFGLAKHYDKEGRATSTIRVQGCSEGYSPVEQYIKIDRFSPMTDIYALGATLYFMLTGTDPLVASDITQDYISCHLPATVSSKTRAAIMNAMKKEKTERTDNISIFLEDLGLEEKGQTIQIPVNHDEVPCYLFFKKLNLRLFQDNLSLHFPSDWHSQYTLYIAAAFFVFLGYLTPMLFSSDINEDIVEKIVTEDDNFIPKANEDYYDHDMQNAVIVDSTTILEMSEKEKLFNEYLKLTKECCTKAQYKHGDYNMIQVLLDAKYYYYDKAKSLAQELYSESLQANPKLDKLVTREYNYWIKQGNELGKDRKNYKLKKTYYERAYKLRENPTLKAKIEWLEQQLTKKKRK